MPEAITLSESAVAVLRFRVRGYRIKVTDRSRAAFRELAAAGIMEPVSDGDGNPEGDFRFTEDGAARREELLRESEAYLRGLQPSLPDRIDLSEAARELLGRLVLTKERVEVTPENKPIYRELAAAGILFPVSGFATGPEANFRFTDQGWDRRHEWISDQAAAPPAGSP
jgi:hypothetical protein